MLKWRPKGRFFDGFFFRVYRNLLNINVLQVLSEKWLKIGENL